MKKSLLLSLLFCCLEVALFAQDNNIFTGCATDLLHRQHPALQDAQNRNDEALYRAALKSQNASLADHSLRTLPVVVHIIHNGGPENISDAQVQQGIAQLNAAFEASVGTGVNTEVQFCLAQRDPQGQTTSGITRDQSALTVMDLESQDIALKNLNRWAPTCFINIWVVAAINSSSSGNGVVGYAYFPSAHGLNMDGIVMEASYFGSSQANTGVLTHEMGHYLGLYHTFQGGCTNNNCLLDGDRVCDTPPDQTTFSSCNPNANSCGTDADDNTANNPFTTDVADLGEDYMDYSTLQCFSKFTQGQSERMNWFITNVRSSLQNCLSCQTPCPAPLTANITLPSAAQTIVVGSSINFTATASNSTNYAWNIDTDPVFSTTLNTSYTFNTVGMFWVKFRAISDDPSHCIDALDSVKVTVSCNAAAVFSAPPLIQAGMTTTFTNNSTNATGYEWLLDNVQVATSANLSYTFVNTGVYQLCLRASNANCSNTLCATVYVHQDSSATAGCDNTFIQSLAGMGGSRPNIFPHPNGDFFATGLRNDSTVIVRFDQGGAALWARAFKFGADASQILDMFVDVSGDLIGVAAPEAVSLGDLRTTAFRFNLTSNAFVWIRRLPETRYTQIHALDATSCVLTGESNSGRSQLTRINKNTGVINGYNLEGEGGDFFSMVHNGTLYGTCRRYFNASGDFRASVFAHNLNTGAFQWQNSIISRGNTSGSNETRMYPEKPIVDNDNLLVLAAGDLEGFGGYFFGSSELVVAKTSLTGNVLWTKQYILSGHDSPAATAIVPTATGYYIVCNLFQDALNNFDFAALIKTDKQGNVEWAKRLGLAGKNIARNIMERNGYLYLTMSSDSYAPNDLLLVKLDQQGNTNTTCDFVQPIAVEVVTLTNIQDQRNYVVVPFNSSPTTLNTLSKATSLTTVTYCNTPCLCPEIFFSAGPDTTICLGQPVTLQATPGFDVYEWSPAASLDNPNIQNPTATPLATTTYIVKASKSGVELIENSDFSQGNTGFSSSYIFNGAGYGHYYLSNNATQVHNLWSVPNDHTPTADNMLMLVDGDATGNFPAFWQQTILAQPNTDYVFQFWIAMAYPSSPPEIQVKINGVVQNTFTLLGGAPIWQHCTLTINSGVATQLNIELINLNTAGFGNDFAIDDISLESICHYTDSILVSTRTATAQTLDLGPDISSCINAVHTFDAGAGFDSYLWQDGSNSSTFTAFSAGTYWVMVQDSCGGIQHDTVQVILTATPSVDLGADKIICLGASTQLSYTSNGVFTSYNWSPAIGLSCTTCPSPFAAPLVSTVYYFVGSTADGCTNLDSISIVVIPQAASTQNITQCINEPFVYNGNVYTANGTYVDILTSGNGCDSTVTTNLLFVPLPTRTETITFCPGQSVAIGGNTYTQSGIVIDTLTGTIGCDTIATYILVVGPLLVRTETITFCAGESVAIGGNTYSQPGIVVDTLLSTTGGCDTIVTYTLQYQQPEPSTVTISCPYNIGVAVLPGTEFTVVNYDLPTTTSDCPCPGISLTLTAGLPSGSAFPVGPTTVCYTAQDSCGNSATCCFQVYIREELACDIKENGCMKYELLNITADAGMNYTYRIRVTNKCANKMIYTAIQLPNAVTALEPPNMAVFEAESGRQYAVSNPSFTPFYSTRFQSVAAGISSGQTDILRYTLPPQSVPLYIHIGSKLETQEYYEAHLNTFYCPIGVTPDDDKPAERASDNAENHTTLRLYPNPSVGELFVDLADWSGESVQIRILNVYGQQMQTMSTQANDDPYQLQLMEGMANGLYLLEVSTSSGTKQVVRFVMQR